MFGFYIIHVDSLVQCSFYMYMLLSIIRNEQHMSCWSGWSSNKNYDNSCPELTSGIRFKAHNVKMWNCFHRVALMRQKYTYYICLYWTMKFSMFIRHDGQNLGFLLLLLNGPQACFRCPLSLPPLPTLSCFISALSNFSALFCLYLSHSLSLSHWQVTICATGLLVG